MPRQRSTNDTMPLFPERVNAIFPGPAEKSADKAPPAPERQTRDAGGTSVLDQPPENPLVVIGTTGTFIPITRFREAEQRIANHVRYGAQRADRLRNSAKPKLVIDHIVSNSGNLLMRYPPRRTGGVNRWRAERIFDYYFNCEMLARFPETTCAVHGFTEAKRAYLQKQLSRW